MRLRVSMIVSVLLLVSGCGSDGGSISLSKDQPEEAFDEALCAEFDKSDGPSDELLDGLPARFRPATDAVTAFGSAMDEGDYEAIASKLGDVLAEDGLDDDLRELSEFAEAQCGSTEGGDVIGMLATVATMTQTDRDDDYCAVLEEQFSSSGADDAPGGDFEALAEVAPDTHRDAIQAFIELDGSPSADQENVLFGAFFGVGIYAEQTCGVDGAFVNLLTLGAMSGADDDVIVDDPSSDDGSEDDSGSAAEIDPSSIPEADPATANAFVPSGTSLTFEARAIDLEEDEGTHLASIVVPVDWETFVGFNVSVEPPIDSDFSLFSSVSFSTSCDGVCEPTDWDARLRAADGYLSTYLQNHEGATERAVVGSEGTVVMGAAGSGAALVMRWDDSVDHYFSCEVSLDEDDAALTDAFVAACEAAVPAWFPVG